jgi:hypothetical protein
MEFDGPPAAFRAGQGVACLAEAFFRLTADRALIVDASG